MILLCILAPMTLIGITNSAPLSSYATTGLSNDHPDVFLLVDERIPEFESEMLNSGGNLARKKRIGPLSIMDNVNVLRERITKELSRRKAVNDLRQIEANRRILESIGKRSAPEYDPDTERFIGYSSLDHGYANQHLKNRERSAAPSKIAERTQVWFEENNPLFHEIQDDQAIRANELRLL